VKGWTDDDVTSRIRKGNGVFVQPYPVWINHSISKYVKIRIFNTNVKSLLLYTCETRGSVLAFGTQVHGFAPGRSLRIFRTKKILSTPSFRGEVKPSVPCRSFTACKRYLNVTWKLKFRQNSRTFLAHSSTFRPLGALAWWYAWRRLVAKVGTSNPDRTVSPEGCSA